LPVPPIDLGLVKRNDARLVQKPQRPVGRVFVSSVVDPSSFIYLQTFETQYAPSRTTRHFTGDDSHVRLIPITR